MAPRYVESSLWSIWRGMVAPFSTRRNRATSKRTRHSTRRNRPYRYVRGVYKGNFYRFKVPNPTDKAESEFTVPRLPPATPMMPKPFKSVPPSPAAAEAAEAARSTVVAASQRGEQFQQLQHMQQQHERSGYERAYERFLQWWKVNWPVLLLNAGSFCSLLGFTRTDVLELRTLSTMGSLSYVLYALNDTNPIKWAPVLWSTLFATVNATKIYFILDERRGRVVLSAQQEKVYEDFFLEHGLTPKQFEMLWNSAKIVKIKKGGIILRSGQKIEKVRLVLEGSTKANILGRHLSAASSAPARRTKQGGDSGAWIGEMSFLESYGAKRKSNMSEESASGPAKSETKQSGKKRRLQSNRQEGASSSSSSVTEQQNGYELSASMLSQPRMERAYYTIRAAEDSTLLEWTRDDMRKLMDRSPDMRAALTRAMTAAVVGKVINFSVGRTSSKWTSWIGDWKLRRTVTQVYKQSPNKGSDEESATVIVDDDDDDDDDDSEKKDVRNSRSSSRPSKAGPSTADKERISISPS